MREPVTPPHVRRVHAIIGPGLLPEGCREATERRAAALGLDCSWVEVAGGDAAAEQVRAAVDTGSAVLLYAGALADTAAVAAALRAVRGPCVAVDPDVVAEPGVVLAACHRVIHGRGRASFTWAVRWLATGAARPGTVVRHGDQPAQVGELRLPDGAATSTSPPSGRRPVAVLLHGGFWLDWWERDLMDGFALALTDRGWATWNMEYRRMGPTGGGWPGSLEDACAGVGALAGLAREASLDLDRVVLVGHSAGALLAAYVAGRHHLDDAAPGAVPAVRVGGLVTLAGVLDLEAAAAADLGGGAVAAFLGGDAAGRASRARLASPRRLVPLGVDTLVVHGDDDRLVPVTFSTDYAQAAREAAEEVVLEIVPGDHFAVIDPAGAAFAAVAAWLAPRAHGPPHG